MQGRCYGLSQEQEEGYIMKTITEEQAIKNTVLGENVEKDSELKMWLVDYVGTNSEKHVPSEETNGEVTVQMIVDVMAEEFPEFLMAVAEENWVRGYRQALEDVDDGMKLMRDNRKSISEEQWVEEYHQHAERLDHE